MMLGKCSSYQNECWEALHFVLVNRNKSKILISKFRWALGSAILVMLAFMSYLTATFVIESMAAANAVVQWKR